MPLPLGEQAEDLESGGVADVLEQARRPLDLSLAQPGLVVGPGRLRPGLLRLEDRCRHENPSPGGFDRPEAGGYIPLPAVNHHQHRTLPVPRWDGRSGISVSRPGSMVWQTPNIFNIRKFSFFGEVAWPPFSLSDQ